VEAAFEGPDAAVDEMVAWSGVGPDLANVDHLDAVVEDPLGETGFRVTG
jgi:acylphosphatase